MLTHMLTHMFDETSERGCAITPPGMAFWADTGPPGVTCESCWFYQKKRCRKYKQLTGINGKHFPAYMPSCKYFEHAQAL